MGNIDAIFCDLDGTLLNNQHEVSSYNRQIMQMVWDQDIPFHIVTGRSPNAVQTIKTLEPKGFTGYFNGCMVKHAQSQEVLYRSYIDVNDNQTLIDIVKENDLTAIWYIDDIVYSNKKNQLSQDYFDISGLMPRIENLHDFANENFIKIVLKWHDEDKLNRINQQITNDPNLNLWGVYSLACSLELLNKNANKGAAIRAIADHNGYNLKQCIAFGDNANDVPMLNNVGHPVVMKNGRPSVVEMFNNIADDAHQDGVGHYIYNQLNLK